MVVNDKIFKYTGVYWSVDDSKKSTTLHQFISNTFYKHILKYSMNQKSIIFKQLEKAATEDEESKIKQELQKLNQFEEKVNIYCNTVNFRNNLVEDIKHHITKPNIKLDDKPFLFVFNNKVFDLQKGEFVKPNPHDYLTVSCGYDYTEYYDDDNVIELNKIIDTIFTNPDVKNFNEGNFYESHAERVIRVEPQEGRQPSENPSHGPDSQEQQAASRRSE